MAKVTFAVDQHEDREPGDVVITKSWAAKEGGQVVGYIYSRISDANQSYEKPGYTVTVQAEYVNGDRVFIKQSGTFQNRSLAEARENRSWYVSQAKDKFRGVL